MKAVITSPRAKIFPSYFTKIIQSFYVLVSERFREPPKPLGRWSLCSDKMEKYRVYDHGP